MLKRTEVRHPTCVFRIVARERIKVSLTNVDLFRFVRLRPVQRVLDEVMPRTGHLSRSSHATQLARLLVRRFIIQPGRAHLRAVLGLERLPHATLTRNELRPIFGHRTVLFALADDTVRAMRATVLAGQREREREDVYRS